MAEETDIKNQSFLGTGWDFPPTFFKGANAVKMISDVEDIRSSLEILLSTALGERIMEPRYGCDLRRLLFEPVNATLVAYMRDLVNDAILIYEPRIVLINFKINTNNDVEGKIELILDYMIPSTNTRYNYVYPYYLTEASVQPTK
jgi:uncharacterized protein